jgi:hypothetical protein
MRNAKLAFIGFAAVLAVIAAPAFARNAAPPQKTEDKSVSSSSCHAYQMAADGSWSVLSCHEAGGTEHKPPSKSGEEEPR